MSLKEIVFSTILSIIKNHNNFIILIGGSGCVGKSSFSLDLKKYINKNLENTVSILDLDSYLIERHIRESNVNPISGYNPDGYELIKAIEDINYLIKGNNIKVRIYDKRTSIRSKLSIIKPAKILIIEGVMSLTNYIRNFGTLRIFLNASDNIEYENRIIRESNFGFDIQRIESKFAQLRKDKKKYITPLRKYADIIIELGNNYTYRELKYKNLMNRF